MTVAVAPNPLRRPSVSTPFSQPSAQGSTSRSPRVSSSLNSSTRRLPPRRTSPVLPINETGETTERSSALLHIETEQKEQLLVQIQDREQTIASLLSENSVLYSALNAAETRVNELYGEQSRSDIELAQRVDVTEKLRAQVRELEKERRDVQRRYNEQITTFDAERQSFYDNEQHLKSRIQSLLQPQKPLRPSRSAYSEEINDTDVNEERDDTASAERCTTPISIPQDLDDPDYEPAEITALKLELSTLSTSYSSLQSTVVLLHSQLVDLKRVNHELQEDNESYMILLREKTLSGQFDLMRQVGGGSSTDDDEGDGELDVNGDIIDRTDLGSLISSRGPLDPVVEEGDNLDFFENGNTDTYESEQKSIRLSRHSSRQGRNRTISNKGLRGESLANLPITGPGLDLAAELGRAENKDILGRNAMEESDSAIVTTKKSKRGKKTPDDICQVSSDASLGPNGTQDVDALRTEVKSLKDANKALSLYASKIIDRIISREGYEYVLSVDYEATHARPQIVTSKSLSTMTKPRSQSVIARSTSNPTPDSETCSSLASSSPQASSARTKVNRRSLSIDWNRFSIFNSEKKPESSLRPLTLKPGTSPVTGTRKFDTQEDEEDKKERERLYATMRLMGIELPAPTHLAVNTRSPSVTMSPGTEAGPASANTGLGTPLLSRRFSLFGNRTPVDNSDVSSARNSGGSGAGLGISRTDLTQEALERAEAENSLAALDERERVISVEIAKGGSGGFTQAPRSSKRSRRSGGSGSTIWSAGMSGTGDGSDHP